MRITVVCFVAPCVGDLIRREALQFGSQTPNTFNKQHTNVFWWSWFSRSNTNIGKIQRVALMFHLKIKLTEL